MCSNYDEGNENSPITGTQNDKQGESLWYDSVAVWFIFGLVVGLVVGYSLIPWIGSSVEKIIAFVCDNISFIILLLSLLSIPIMILIFWHYMKKKRDRFEQPEKTSFDFNDQFKNYNEAINNNNYCKWCENFKKQFVKENKNESLENFKEQVVKENKNESSENSKEQFVKENKNESLENSKHVIVFKLKKYISTDEINKMFFSSLFISVILPRMFDSVKRENSTINSDLLNIAIVFSCIVVLIVGGIILNDILNIKDKIAFLEECLELCNEDLSTEKH